MAIKKRNVGSNQIDGSKLLLLNDDAIRAVSSSGQSVSLIKLDAENILRILSMPRVSGDPAHADELARKGYVDSKVVDSYEGSQSQAAPSVRAMKEYLNSQVSQIQLYKHDITSQDATNGYFDIPNLAVAAGIIVVTNSNVVLLQDVDYTVATSPTDPDKSRLTFVGNAAPNGAYALDTLDKIHVYYFPVSDAVVVSGGGGGTGDVMQTYVDAADQSLALAIATERSRAQAAESSLSSAISSGVQEAKSYTDTAVAGIVNTAPAALDTLNELAAALGNDSSFSVSVTNSIASKASSSDLLAEVSRAQAAESGKASTSLSNLANTAVNASIVPATSNTLELGSSSSVFSRVWGTKLSTPSGEIAVGGTPSGVNSLAFYGFGGSNVPVSLISLNRATASTNSNAVYVETGNATGTTSSSGLINIQTGTATSNSGDILLTTGTATGTRGKVSIQGRVIELGVGASGVQAQFNFTSTPSIASAVSLINTSSTSPLSIYTTGRSSASTNSQNLYLESGNATGTTSNSGDIVLQTGTATGTRGKISLSANTIDVNSTTIVNVANPVNATDAANRAYVDAQPLVGLNLYVELPTSATYVLCEYPYRAFTIQELRVRTQAGSASVTVQVNNVSVTGMTNLTATTTQSSATATAGNVVAVGQRVTLVVNTTTGCTGLSVTVRIS